MGKRNTREALAPGFHDAGNYGYWGALCYVGCNGYSWSSAVSDTYGMRLDFHPYQLYPNYLTGRGCGFPLRCLSE